MYFGFFSHSWNRKNSLFRFQSASPSPAPGDYTLWQSSPHKCVRIRIEPLTGRRKFGLRHKQPLDDDDDSRVPSINVALYYTRRKRPLQRLVSLSPTLHCCCTIVRHSPETTSSIIIIIAFLIIMIILIFFFVSSAHVTISVPNSHTHTHTQESVNDAHIDLGWRRLAAAVVSSMETLTFLYCVVHDVIISRNVPDTFFSQIIFPNIIMNSAIY